MRFNFTKVIYVAYFLFALLTALPVTAQNEAVQAFDEGTQFLMDGDFPNAISAFATAERAGWASTELYYNVGLAHYRMDHLGQAIQYLERALLLDSENEKVVHSLNVARLRTQDQFSQLPDPFWKKLHAWTARVMPMRTAFWLGISIWFGFGALVIVRLLFAVRGDWWRRMRVISGALGALLLIHALATSAWPPTDPMAVILASEVDLVEQADPGAASVQNVHEGLVVHIKSRTSEWTFIQIPNGIRGWVPQSVLGEI